MDIDVNAMMTGDRSLRVEFFVKPVLNAVKTKEQAKDVYEDVEMVRIIAPGGEPFYSRADKYKDRFIDHYEAFKKKKKQSVIGTPIKSITDSPSLAKMLEDDHGITTIEQMVDISDVNLQSIPSGREMKNKAIEFLNSSKDKAEVAKLIRENESLKSEVKELKEKMKELKEKK